MKILCNRNAPPLPSQPALKDRFGALYRREGLSGVIVRARETAMSFLFEERAAYVFKRPLDEPLPAPSPGVPVTLREMRMEDMELFRKPAQVLRDNWINGFAKRLGTGASGVIALSGGRVAGYGWMSVKSEFDAWLGVEIRPENGEGYLYDGYVLPAFRKKGIYPAIVSWRLDYLRRHGCRVAYSIIVKGNREAIECHGKMGFGPEKRVGYLRIAGMKWRVEGA